jgi:hypothetical protein
MKLIIILSLLTLAGCQVAPTPLLESEINSYRGEYVYGNPEARGAIKAHINDKLEGVDRDQLSPEVKEFVNNL